MTTLGQTVPPPAATSRALRLSGISKVHTLAGDTLAKLNPAASERTTVKLSDLDDPTFTRLPSGGEAVTYTVQVLNLPHQQKRNAGAIAGLLRKLYGADVWTESRPGIVNVFSADDAGFAFDNASGATFVLQFIW